MNTQDHVEKQSPTATGAEYGPWLTTTLQHDSLRNKPGLRSRDWTTDSRLMH